MVRGKLALTLTSSGIVFLALWISAAIILSILGRTLGVRRLFATKLIQLFEWFATVDREKEPTVDGARRMTTAEIHRYRSSIKPNHPFEVGDVVSFVQQGLQNILDDEVTKRFDSEELEIWNLLARNGSNIRLKSWRLRMAWVVGFFLRFCILLPIRLVYLVATTIFLAIALTVNQLLLPTLFPDPEHAIRKKLSRESYVILFRLLAQVIGVVIVTHGDSRPRDARCVVANHTTPVDVIILSVTQPYTLVGQKQPGLFGFVEKCLTALSTQPHIWFDRSSTTERRHVLDVMREQSEKCDGCPILIFPEGTCINNTSLMMFRKGAFELGVPIQPVAIKYDPRLGDAFWNSQRCSFGRYTWNLLTSWAVWAEVHYLNPMHKHEGEAPERFAKRVKNEIALMGGFVNMDWDGMLKRTMPNPNFKQELQTKYSKTLIY